MIGNTRSNNNYNSESFSAAICTLLNKIHSIYRKNSQRLMKNREKKIKFANTRKAKLEVLIMIS